jgi:hypothetical protein
MSTDTGLTNRLRQHSRRGGLAVALTMALTTAICLGGFAVIYAQLQPFISDFVSQEPPDDNAVAFNVGQDDETPAPTDEDEEEAAADQDEPTAPEDDGDEGDNPAPAPEPTEPPAPTPTPLPPPDQFTPDLQSNSNATVNLRAEPSAAGGQETIVTPLPPATPIQFLGEQAPAENPAEDGTFWVKVRTVNGDEGWIRQIDTEEYQP